MTIERINKIKIQRIFCGFVKTAARLRFPQG